MSHVEIGSKYDGPVLDRPCLRQMPREWTLEETRVEPIAWERWALVVILLALLMACTHIARAIL